MKISPAYYDRKYEDKLMHPSTLSGNYLKDLADFSKNCVQAASASSSILFKHAANNIKILSLGKQFLRIYPCIPRILHQKKFGGVIFDAHVELFIKCCHSMGWNAGRHPPELHPDAPTEVLSPFNTFASLIKRHGREAKFGAQQNQMKEKNRVTWKKTKSFFDRSSKLFPDAKILRLEGVVDLSLEEYKNLYKRTLSKDNRLPPGLKETTQRFLREVENQVEGAMVCNAFKIDGIGHLGNRLSHILIALNGPTLTEIDDLKNSLPAIWKQISPLGRLLDCSTVNHFQYRGTGATHAELCTREEFHRAAIYLAGTNSMYHVSDGDRDQGLVLGYRSGQR
ncbi:MAG: hypothetical protein V4505_05380 [Pseudomonadota bacterium]